jgi:hypothetical protein
MNHQAEAVIDFGDGEYLFRLTVKQIIELEEKCGAAFAVIQARLWNGLWTANDVVETIRLGLIGGGADPVKAKQLTDRYALPFQYSYPVARAVAGAVMWGFEKSPLGKDQAAPTTNQSASMPPNLSEQPASSESKGMSLDEFRFGNWLQ